MWTLRQLMVPVLLVFCVLGAVCEPGRHTKDGHIRDTELDLGVGPKGLTTPGTSKDKKLKYQQRVTPVVLAQVDIEQQVKGLSKSSPVINYQTSNGIEPTESPKRTSTKLSRKNNHRLNHRKYLIKMQNGRDQSRSSLSKVVKTWRQKQRNQTSDADQIKRVLHESPTQKMTTIQTRTSSVPNSETGDPRNIRNRRPIWHHRHQQHHTPRKRRSPGAFMVHDRTTLNPFISPTQAFDFLSRFDAQPVPRRWPVSMILPEDDQTQDPRLQPAADAIDESAQKTIIALPSNLLRKYDRCNSTKQKSDHVNLNLSNTAGLDYVPIKRDSRRNLQNKIWKCRVYKCELPLRKRKKCQKKQRKTRKGCQVESRKKTSQERTYKLPVSASDSLLAQNDEPSSLNKLNLIEPNEGRRTTFLKRKSHGWSETTASVFSSNTPSLSLVFTLSHVGFHENKATEEGRDPASPTSRTRHGHKSSRKHSGDRKTAGAAHRHTALTARFPYHAKIARSGESTPSYQEPLGGDGTSGHKTSPDNHLRHSQSSGILSSQSPPYLINFNQRSNSAESHSETGSSGKLDVVRRKPDQNTPEGPTPAHTFGPTNSGLESENDHGTRISEAVGGSDAANHSNAKTHLPSSLGTAIVQTSIESEAIEAMEKATQNKTQENNNENTPRSNSSQLYTHVPDLAAARLWKEKMLKMKASTQPTSDTPRTQHHTRGNQNPATGTSRRGRLGASMPQTTTSSVATRKKLWSKEQEESVTRGTPFIGHTTAVNFLGGPTQRASKTSHEGRREAREFNRFMSEGMCEIFSKHYVPTNIGGKCV